MLFRGAPAYSGANSRRFQACSAAFGWLWVTVLCHSRPLGVWKWSCCQRLTLPLTLHGRTQAPTHRRGRQLTSLQDLA